MTLTGVYVPLITPFDESGAIAADVLESLAAEILDAGAAGLVALGTTGEPSALTPAERRIVTDVVARVCRDRGAPLIVGGDPLDVPADAIALSPVPPFVRPGEDGVVAWFTRQAATSPVPIVVYHVPYRTGQPLTQATLRRLAAIDGIVGVKYATGAADPDVIGLLADPPPGFAILGGDDVVVSPLLALGAHGGILASAHLATARFAELTGAWRDGDVSRARALGHRLAALSAQLFAGPNPTVLKAVLHAQGRIPSPAVRLPLLTAGPPPARLLAAAGAPAVTMGA